MIDVNSLPHDFVPGPEYEAVLRDAYDYLRTKGDIGQDLYKYGTLLHPAWHTDYFRDIVVPVAAGSKAGILKVLDKWNNMGPPPVGVEFFLESDYYLGLAGQIYPAIKEDIRAINSGEYTEAVLTGGIGVAKTTIALWTSAYQLYLLSLIPSPQLRYGLDKSSEILMIFQSLNKDLARELDYTRFRALIEGSDYFQEVFPFDKELESSLKFKNRIIVKPVSGSDTAAIGQNVIGGVIDELNFMSVVENSKRSVDGGSYDQAVTLYNSIARRRKSRFMERGKMPGVLCLVSSKRYPGQFTDLKVAEARKELAETGKTTTYIYDKRVWDIKPAHTFTGVWFKVFVGDLTHKPRVLDDDEDLTGLDPELIVEVPIEYKSEFETDIVNALRDIAGVATLATVPYITNLEALSSAFEPDRPSIFTTDVGDFVARPIGINKKVVQAADPEFPRFAHVDLGLTSDHAGVVIGHVPEFVELDQDGDTIWMPKVVIDGTLRVAPPQNGEINFEKIRKLFYVLKNIGFPLRWITFDSYQSVDSMQILRSKGFFTGTQSMDTSTAPYDVTKTAILEGRLHIPEDKHLQMELARLERTLKGKVDHPPNFSKDVADALAGVVYGLTMQRYVWAMHGHQPIGVLDDLYDLQEVSDKKKHPDD